MDFDEMKQAYLDIVRIMRMLYQECRLVHADLSEYNLLYYKNELVVIDVSQSVEHDHPMSLEFLRRDCINVNDFFNKNDICILTTKYLFDFITDIKLSLSSDKDMIESHILTLVKESEVVRSTDDPEAKMIHELDEKVFEQIYIPRTLSEIPMEEFEKPKIKPELFEKLTGA